MIGQGLVSCDANITSISNTSLTCVKYSFQNWEDIKLETDGLYSILMMFIATIGSEPGTSKL